jgi:bifunctional DNase/RNase
MAGDRATEIEMVVESVRVHMRTGRHVLLLKEVGAGRILPVWIGPWEAQAIAMRLQGITSERPLTHDLFAAALGELGVRVDRVIISSLADETFHARLVLVTPDSQHELDARPSDAIALAVRLECPIYASAGVLDQAAALPDDEDDDADEPDTGEGGEARRRRVPPETLEATGELIDPTKLDIFREFVNSLDPDDPRSGGSSGSGGPGSGGSGGPAGPAGGAPPG